MDIHAVAGWILLNQRPLDWLVQCFDVVIFFRNLDKRIQMVFIANQINQSKIYDVPISVESIENNTLSALWFLFYLSLIDSVKEILFI